MIGTKFNVPYTNKGNSSKNWYVLILSYHSPWCEEKFFHHRTTFSKLWPQRQHRRHYDRQRTSFHQESLKSSFLLYSRYMYLVYNRNHPSSKKKLTNVKYKQSDPHVTAHIKFIFFYLNLIWIKTSYIFLGGWGWGGGWNEIIPRI